MQLRSKADCCCPKTALIFHVNTVWQTFYTGSFLSTQLFTCVASYGCLKAQSVAASARCCSSPATWSHLWLLYSNCLFQIIVQHETYSNVKLQILPFKWIAEDWSRFKTAGIHFENESSGHADELVFTGLTVSSSVLSDVNPSWLVHRKAIQKWLNYSFKHCVVVCIIVCSTQQMH